MYKDGKIEKTLKPSERKSITEFSSRFGTGPTYEEKARNKKLLYAVCIALGVILLLFVGYFITDVLLKISETPYQSGKIGFNADIINMTEDSFKWTISRIIQG